MQLLRQRHAELGAGPTRPVRVSQLDEHTYLVRADDDRDREGRVVATRVTVANGKVVAMQQVHDDPGSTAPGT